MPIKHSMSLIVIWELANAEAKRLGSETIAPGHFLVSFFKAVDINLAKLAEVVLGTRREGLEELLREVGRLENAITAAGVEPARFRRQFRAQMKGDGQEELRPNQGRLHRSLSSRYCFLEAEQLAEVTESELLPIHLMYAVLAVKDASRDGILSKMGSNIELLRKTTKKEMLSMSPFEGLAGKRTHNN